MTTFQQGEQSEEHVVTPAGFRGGKGNRGGAGAATRARQLLTFRLDPEFRQRLRTRLAREGRSLSEVVIRGLQLYLQEGPPAADDAAGPGPVKAPGPVTTAVASVAELVLPEEVTAALRDLRSSGQSKLLSATLAALHDAGWPLRPLAAALGISRQAVLARVRQPVPAGVRSLVPAVPAPKPFPRRRSAQPEGRRPHLTVKIDQALRAAAHRAAQLEGSSLSQVIERILDHYLRHGLPAGEPRPGDTTPARPAPPRRREDSAPAGEGG